MGALIQEHEYYLRKAYSRYYNAVDPFCSYKLMELMECGKSAYEKVMGALEFLRDKDYIILEISDTYAKFKIAQKGIEYFEPKQSSSPITINQGSNNTAVIGNNNRFSVNFNSVLQEIDNSNLDEKSKVCLHSFVRELETTPQESRLQKVKKFVEKAVSGTLEASIPSLLTYLMSRYLHL